MVSREDDSASIVVVTVGCWLSINSMITIKNTPINSGARRNENMRRQFFIKEIVPRIHCCV